jgi:hypothetical protein
LRDTYFGIFGNNILNNRGKHLRDIFTTRHTLDTNENITANFSLVPNPYLMLLLYKHSHQLLICLTKTSYYFKQQ